MAIRTAERGATAFRGYRPEILLNVLRALDSNSEESPAPDGSGDTEVEKPGSRERLGPSGPVGIRAR